MALFLYRKYLPSPYNAIEKRASIHRQGLYQLPVILFCFIVLVVISLTSKNFVYAGLSIFETFLPLRILIAFLAVFMLLGQLLIVREIFIYHVYRIDFSLGYVEVEKPINLLSALIVPLLFLFFSLGLFQHLMTVKY